MVLKITNLHILRYLPTCWLYLLELQIFDNQKPAITASESNKTGIGDDPFEAVIPNPSHKNINFIFDYMQLIQVSIRLNSATSHFITNI